MAVYTGTNESETLTGSNDDDVISGLGGDDTIYDGGGNDVVYGGSGNDIIHNQGGTDQFYGGSGIDTLVTDVTGLPPSYTLLFDATAGVHGRLEASPYPNDTIAGIENFTLIGDWNSFVVGDDKRNIFRTDIGDDILSGRAGNDELFSGGGNDQLNGGVGDDRLNGGAGKDTIKGGAGIDTIKGGKGSDVITGGKGDDIMSGNGGADDFIFTSGFGNDIVTDFDAFNNKEDIDLSGVTQIKGWNDLNNNHMEQDGLDVVITQGVNAITLADVDIGDLGRGDFIF